MMNLNNPMFHEAKQIAQYGGRFAFGVSLGRDTACVLFLMSKLLKDFPSHKFFYWSHYPKMLPYQQRYLSLIEKRYGFRADVHIWPEEYKGKQAKWIADYMDKHGCSLCIQGHHMDESLQRRGMLKAFKDGIDYVRHYGYPLRSWTKPKIRAFVKANRIPLNIEYQLGFEGDFQEFRNGQSFVLRHQISEADYQAAIAQDPNIEIDYMRTISNPNFVANLETTKGA